MEAEHISKCDCGAVTVTIDSMNYSMKHRDFNRLFGKHRIYGSMCGCNYCVNHRGVDLCACGSGISLANATMDSVNVESLCK